MVTVRLARNEDGPGIGALFHRAGYPDYGVDWAGARVGGWWIVAEAQEEVIGALQINAGQPFGFIGEIVIDKAWRARKKNGHGFLDTRFAGTVAEHLYGAALAALAEVGIELVFGVVHEQMTPHRELLTARGAVELGWYRLLAKRLKPVRHPQEA